MTDTRKVQLQTEVDASGAKAGFKEVTQGAKDMARQVGDAGKEAGKGLDSGLGSGADGAGQKVDRATKSIIQSIERATAAAQAGGRSTAAYFEQIAKQRGVSGDALAPYIAQLKAAEAAQQVAVGSLNSMGLSAKQTAAALRGVPAQFTDIITSLQGGQAPLTVFLQQGGQLRDMFGGAGAAAKALGGFVASLITPLTLAGGAAAALGYGLIAGRQEAQEFNRTLVLTGNQAGLTVGSLTAMAERLDALGTTQGKASESLLSFVRAGRVGADSLERFTKAAIDLEKVGGPAVEETAKAFADLGKDPLQASLKLNEATGFLTASVYEQIKALTDQGKTVEAAKVAQEAYYLTVTTQAPLLAQQLGLVERAWNGIKAAAAGTVDILKDIGRNNGVEGLIRDLEQQIQFLRRAGGDGQGLLGVFAAGRIKEAEESIALLRRSLATEEQIARVKAEQSRQASVRNEFDKAGEQYLSKQFKLEREIAQARELGLRAGLSEAQIQERIVAIREKARDKSGDNKAAKALEDEARALEKVRGLSGSYFKELEQLKGLRDEGLITEQEFAKAYDELARKQPINIELSKAEAKARDEANKAIEAATKAYDQQLAALRKSANSVAEQVQKLRDEEQAAGIAAAKNISLAEAIQLVAIARLEEAQARSLDLGEVDALQAEITARRELIELMRSSDLRNASKRSAQDAARDWERASQDIERSLTDALLRGFESGKDFGQNLVSTIKNLFSTLVLRPLIQPVVGALAGGLGLSGAANAAGASGGISSLGSLSTLGGLLSSGSLLGNTLSVSGGLLGLGELSTLGIGEAFGGGLAALTGGNIAGGLSTLAGAALPFVGGAALIGNALGLFRSNRQVGAGITGQLGGTVEDFVVNRRGGSLFSGPSYSTPTTGVSSFNADLQATFNSLRTNAAAMAQALGLSTSAALNFTTAIGSEKLSDDTGGQGIRLEGLSAEQVAAKIQAELTAANERLAQSVLGTAASAFQRSGESAAQTLERLSGSLTGVNGVLGVLGQSLLSIGLNSASTASALLDQFGGLQQYQSAAAQYLQDYYTQAERTALGTQQLTSALGKVGLALPASRDAYRDLVEAQDLSTESGRQAYAALLQLAPAFAELVPAVAEVGAVVDQTAAQLAEAAARQAEAGRRVLADLAADTGNLQVELLRAQGQGGAANALQRQLDLSGITAGLSSADAAAATAAYDLNAALREQITAAQDAAQAVREAAAADAAREREGEGLERQILQLTGDTAALRALELAALDPSNRALQERIYALQDAATAEAEAARVAQEAAQRAQAVASERAGLEQRILQLQGDTTALRARELAALDPVNRALQETVYALEDAAAAAQQAAQVRSEAQGLEQRILQLQGDTTALRALELAALDPANRALQLRIYALEDAAAAEAEAARVAQEAAQRQEAVASAALSREARIAQLLGLTSEVRRIELESLDAYNRGLQETIYELEDAAAAAQKTAQVAGERAGLERQLLQLQGDTAALREMELAALDPSNRALQLRIYALQDAAAAEAEAARVAQEAAQRAQAVASERANLEQRLLQLQGDTAALRALELAGVDESNRALLRQIFALEDQQAAAQSAAQALEAFNAKLSGLGDTRFDLEQQLLKLQGRDAEAAALLRTRELAKLTEGLTTDQAAQVVAAYDYNEALRQQITSLQEAQAAQQQAAEAAQQMRDTWQGLATSLLDEAASIRRTTIGDTPQTYAQLQAQFALATAAARAGDQGAAGSLPELARSLLAAGEGQVTSYADLQRLRAGTAASLEATGNFINTSVLAGSFAGVAVAFEAANRPLLNEIAELRTQNADQARALAELQRRWLQIVERWEVDGMPETRDEA